VYAWLATVGATVVGSAALTLATSLPRPTDSRDELDGRIRSVYVDPHVRRRGIATALVRAAIARAHACGVSRLTLGASPDGKPMYEKLGFVRNHHEMVFSTRDGPGSRP
jgi:GNAT superfamily N-acetyltransferase